MNNEGSPVGAKPQAAVGWVMLIGTMVATFYFMFTYSGPFRWFAELQLQWWGKYYEKLAFLLTYLLLFVPLYALNVAVRKTLGLPAVPPVAAGQGAGDGSAVSSMSAPPTRRAFWNFALLVGVIFTGMGGFMWYRGASAGALTQVGIRDFAAGRRPASRYLDVQGVALWEAAASVESRGTKYYVPLVAPEWSPPTPVSVFMEVREKDYEGHEGEEAGVFRGVVAATGLPGFLRDRLQESDLRPAENYVVLDYNANPATQVNGGRWLTGIGAAALLIGLIVGFVQVKRAGVGAQSAPTQVV